MELMMSARQTHEIFCSFHHPIRKQSLIKHRIKFCCSNFVSEKPKIDGSRKRRRNRVLAVSKTETANGRLRLSNMEKNPQGRGNSDHNFEEFESNNYLLRLVRNGELEEGFRHLENMVYRGDIPDIIPCTSLIRGFCRIGKTKKATRIMEILEESGAVPDVITYNVLISGYCKSGDC